MKEHRHFFAWSALGIVAAVFCAAMLFFNFNNLLLWAALNDPFQKQWTAVQLSNGEILYGHLAGVSATTVGLRNVYSLKKITVPAPAVALQPMATSSDFSLGVAPVPAPQQKYIPVDTVGLLFIDRTSILYFNFLPADDPALPYLH